MMRGRSHHVVVLLPLLFTASGCSVKNMAMRSVGNMLAGGGDVFASDEDPQLVREAIPFALKTHESILAEQPEHGPLLVATARGFTQYAYGFVLRDAELLQDEDFRASLAVRHRVRKLLLRGRDYGLRALELEVPGITDAFGRGEVGGVEELGLEDIGAMFWTGASWGAAIGVLKNDAELIADLPVVEALLRRVLELDEGFDRGAAHEIMITLEAGLAGGSLDRAGEHYERALELSDGNSASPMVSYAETVLVQRQERAAFEETLERALAVDVDAEPSLRLMNLLAQERARWLLGRTEDLFLE